MTAKSSPKKRRLDVLVAERGLAESRSRAQALIMAGRVRVGGQPATKAGQQVREDVEIEVEEGLPYVSRGGLKLEAALDAFPVRVKGAVCADVGASTGGFTDCLLQRGAVRVYAVDVGYGQIAWSLRQDGRVVLMERTNARYLESLPEEVALITIDVSFISLRLIIPAALKWLKPEGDVVALLKPQFEAGRERVGKGGVVRDKRVHKEVLLELCGWMVENGLSVLGVIPSPIKGPAGNVEFLLHLRRAEYGESIDFKETLKRVLE
jgi:23S rRNA (cytidine1920-2'-O)/16S rRNA (cytidine1409-2'-O)-methyltransferase